MLQLHVVKETQNEAFHVVEWHQNGTGLFFNLEREKVLSAAKNSDD